MSDQVITVRCAFFLKGAFAPERVPQWSIPAMIESISAITLATHNMSRAVCFYRMLGFEIVHGGDDASFTSFQAGLTI